MRVEIKKEKKTISKYVEIEELKKIYGTHYIIMGKIKS